MKKTITMLLLLCVAAFAQQKGTFTDPRDKKTYKTVKIGEQTWMAENLNYNAKDSKCYGEGELKEIGWDYDNDRTIYGGPKYTPAEIQAYCIKYGKLYDWETAMKACPSGWHLPTREEWNALYNAVGGNKIAEKVLKSKSGWNDDTYGNSGRKISGNGEDKFGFAMLPGGSYGSFEVGDGFDFAGSCGFFISASICNHWAGFNYGCYLHVCGITDFTDDDFSVAYYNSSKDKELAWNLFSVRCLQDDANYAAKAAEKKIQDSIAEAARRVLDSIATADSAAPIGKKGIVATKPKAETKEKKATKAEAQKAAAKKAAEAAKKEKTDAKKNLTE